jgi:penicillin-binding protein 1C
LVLFGLLDLLFPFRVKVPYSQLLYARDGTVLHAFLSRDDKWRMKTELGRNHPGTAPGHSLQGRQVFSLAPRRKSRRPGPGRLQQRGPGPQDVRRFDHYHAGGPAAGAKERTYGNKLVEVFRALQLEWHYSKERFCSCTSTWCRTEATWRASSRLPCCTSAACPTS